MDYKEAVERKLTEIIGNMDELARCRELWRKIVNAYEQHGEDGIKSTLIKQAKEISQRFEKLLEQLRKKLY